METKERQRELQEALIELERAINKAREAAEKLLTVDNFELWNIAYRTKNAIEAMHYAKLTIDSEPIFKNWEE